MRENSLILKCEIEHLKYPDELHLFEAGDFYEIRGIEATEVATLLDLPVTYRDYMGQVKKERIAIIGFPKAANWYRERLRKKGYYFIFLEDRDGKEED